MSVSRIGTVLSLIVLGFVTLLWPHPPNFTAINAIALFATSRLKNNLQAMALVSTILVLHDGLFGLHFTMPYVYLSLGLTIFLESKLKTCSAATKLPIGALCSSCLFFLVTNFGVWATETLYPHTTSGLLICYTAAIPFFVNQWLGDLFYSSLLFFTLPQLENNVLRKVYNGL